MNEFMMYGLSILSVVLLGYMLIKKYDIKIALFTIGLVLTIIAGFTVGPILEKSINPFIDAFTNIINQFKNYLQGAGLTILILGGYTAYMSSIGANDMTVKSLLKPIGLFKNKYVLVIVVFLVGNLLSLVVPSASNLAIILLATLFPVLKASGMSTLTAAGVIATTATIMPTPLGSDNVAIAEQIGMPVFDYVFKNHALVSIPTLIAIAIVHALWQRHCDKKAGIAGGAELNVETKASKADNFKGIKAFVYTLLPLLPILILICTTILDLGFGIKIDLSVHVVTLISFAIALIIDIIFNGKEGKQALDRSGDFFKGMGSAMDIVVLTVAAAVFVDGLTSIGLIQSLQTSMETMSNSGIILPLVMVLMTAVIVLLSGSGTSLFFAMVPLMVPLAAAAGISPLALALPMGMAGNLLRAVSPVSAVVMIVAGTTKESPMDIVKRTGVPMVFGVVFMFILTMILF
ncbi:TRAP transporter large permease subunit [Erysipelothrix sp. HDW6C]|uniref:C4-dicarboxylate transporter DcuC n=1 Tax=Erysipelothrix sp. HDW6C TaxID=2714930 RepID=UPI00140942A5|nr:C4-dicarboxylate transporter DcuC [Erysipelothrix sp. HDW6C]QIK70416.1 TRAP transporter large permease subunit [Erysipelothrix sp. HDW6C]